MPGGLTWTAKAANLINIFIPDYLNRIYPNFLSREYIFAFLRYSLVGSLSPLLLYYLFTRIKIATFARYFLALVMGVVPQIIFWLHPHGYDGTSFSLFFLFTTPFLLAIITSCLIKESHKIRFIYLFSYVIFMSLSFFTAYNAFRDLKYQDIVISVYAFTLWALFTLISLIILKSCETHK